VSRFAPVVPIHMAEALQVGKLDYLGSYHLLLAHDILTYPEEYRRTYSRVRSLRGDTFIILDNSIVELGYPMGLDSLTAAAAIVRPDCIVIPDKMGDGLETRKMAIKFAREYAQFRHDEMWYGGLTGAPALMGVVQGDTIESAMESIALYYTLPMVEYIGIPRVLVKQHGSRMDVLCCIASIMYHLSGGNVWQPFKGVHLLGFSDDVLDDVSCARMPFVQGIDSNVPIRAGLKGYTLDLHDKQWSERVGPRGDFWNTPLDDLWHSRRGAIQRNMTEFRQLIWR